MMLKRLSLSICTLCLSLGLVSPAAAQQSAATPTPPPDAPTAGPTNTPEVAPSSEPSPVPPPRPIPNVRLYMTSFNLFRVNPIGLETQNRLVIQKRLFNSESVLMRDTFVNAAALIKANPASLKVGPMFEIQPIALFNLRLSYEYTSFLGTMGFLQGYANPLNDFSDDALDAREDAAYSTSGHHFLVEPTLQAKVGPIAVRTKFSIEYWNLSLRDGETTFYDPMLDSLLAGKGWVFTNDSDVVYLSGRWMLGARFSGVWPQYTEDQGVSDALKADNSHMRAGPVVSYAFNTDEGTMFNRPTVLGMVAWYLKHPSRQEAMPYLLLGFSFNSDLMGGR
ncbi:hypothetical protein SAMN05443572_103640 [Myxococcus fulvus]|uniref:Lipoprotein n=1 Tax=Myxococcus fulvus TaxID=33 RepID=A0A511TGT1_MYXFU|nr:hypothetical protein [Myxococcus fulvus]AKF81641.1 hypothetical protein MFUL124B02_22065 [Myxococcus fulvus 124B02]GEN12853.1 hypothetical protein MFU01_78900 [Myxococcus fulvus]SET88057.1 hypothetical protein SAMN05443572_103640 [Myxococcus fulvus]